MFANLISKYCLLTKQATHTKAKHEKQITNMKKIAENFKTTNNSIFVA